MKYKILAIFVSSLLTFSACSTATTTTTAPVSNANTNQTAPVSKTAETTTAPDGATANPAVSPTDVFKSQVEAQRKRDVQAMKQNLSKKTLEMMEIGAKERKKTVDELLAEQNPATANQPQTFESRNEKIEGDSASIEVLDPKLNQWATIPFVKEDGRWKIALDIFMKEMMKKAQEEMEAQKKAAGDGHKH